MSTKQFTTRNTGRITNPSLLKCLSDADEKVEAKSPMIKVFDMFKEIFDTPEIWDFANVKKYWSFCFSEERTDQYCRILGIKSLNDEEKAARLGVVHSVFMVEWARRSFAATGISRNYVTDFTIHAETWRDGVPSAYVFMQHNSPANLAEPTEPVENLRVSIARKPAKQINEPVKIVKPAKQIVKRAAPVPNWKAKTSPSKVIQTVAAPEVEEETEPEIEAVEDEAEEKKSFVEVAAEITDIAETKDDTDGFSLVAKKRRQPKNIRAFSYAETETFNDIDDPEYIAYCNAAFDTMLEHYSLATDDKGRETYDFLYGSRENNLHGGFKLSLDVRAILGLDLDPLTTIYSTCLCDSFEADDVEYRLPLPRNQDHGWVVKDDWKYNGVLHRVFCARKKTLKVGEQNIVFRFNMEEYKFADAIIVYTKENSAGHSYIDFNDVPDAKQTSLFLPMGTVPERKAILTKFMAIKHR